jgi:hypothetical protein
LTWISKIVKLIRSIVDEKFADVHTHLPAQIVAYDSATNLVSIQPCINRIRIDDPNNLTSIRLPQIDDVPVHHLGSGKCLLTVAPQVGSYGSYHVSERSLTRWLNEGGTNPPDQARKFDITDGFFVPGLYTLIEDGDNGLIDPAVSEDRIELRTREKTTFVAVTDVGDVRINASDEIIFNDGEDYAVCYNKLKTAFDDLKSDFNTFVTTKYNLHNHPTAPVGPVSVPNVLGTSSSVSMSSAKVSSMRVPTGVVS